jgi:hypothetical protein
MTQRILTLAGLALAITACGATDISAKKSKKTPVPIDRPAADLPARPVTLDKKGLGDVMGKNVAELKRMFGEPRLDVVEVYGRKLQFSGKPCILDAYLYPDGKNGQEIVTHIDARRSDGAEVDRAACVNALSRR